MRRSTQGFHTFTVSKRLAIKHAEGLLGHFKKYKKRTNEVRIRPDHDKNKIDPYGTHLIIEYPDQNKGLTWNMRISHSLNRDDPCNIKAIINPKLFIGIRDYLTAANSDYLAEVEAKFNSEAMKISPYHLGGFGGYALTRNDYCLNIDVNEMQLSCSPKQLMTLIKRADIPPHYSERTEYDADVSHRQTAHQDSLYLRSKSVVVNYYWKYKQLLSEFPDCPDLEASRNVIRFEVQYRYPKMYYLSKIIRARSDSPELDLKKEMLSDSFCADVIRSYFNRVIRKGNYFTLDGARWMVEAHRFKSKKEDRLISTLELVNKSRGIYKAKATLQDEELEDFRRSLRELDEILVNPVTIPREWGIEHITNPLRAYYDGIAEEQLITGNELLHDELLAEYLL